MAKCKACKGPRRPKHWKKLCDDCAYLASIAGWSKAAKDLLRKRIERSMKNGVYGA